MEGISTILGLVTAHIFGDYVFQSEYISKTKKSNIYHLIVHCWIYTFCFWASLMFFNKMNFTIVLSIFITHFVIDYFKCKFSDKFPKRAYFIDQLLHYIVIFIVAIFIMK